jgi:hypothetical protein
MEKLWRCRNSGDGKIMEVWELWRWKKYEGVGTLEKEKIWRWSNYLCGRNTDEVEL